MDRNIAEIKPAKAYENIDNGALFLDIREWDEIEMLSFEVREQLLIPLSELAFRFREIPAEREIIIGCNSGNRSRQAALFLKQQNFEKVFNLQGGMESWLEMNLPVQWDNPKINRSVTKEEFK